jgi:DNA-directed RNA polymerase subunit K
MREQTRFEMARLISVRALQISLGAKPFIETDLEKPEDIAKLEFEKGVLPFTIKTKPPFKLG